MESVEPGEAGSSKTGTRRRGFRPRRVLGIGCLVVCLVLCAAIGGIAVALQAGPVEIGLPNNNLLKLGSDDFVLSNSSFQNGTTYYVDLNGNGARSILELHNLKDTHSLEIVFNHATKDEQREHHLLTLPSP
jgi:hypothetical protein